MQLLTGDGEWRRDGMTNLSYPTFRCTLCGTTVHGTTIGSFMQGIRGCSCPSSDQWCTRYAEVKRLADERGVVLKTTEEMWPTVISTCADFPTFFCKACRCTVTTTDVASFVHGKALGCGCHNKTESFFFRYITENPGPYQDVLLCDKPGRYNPAWAMTPRDVGVRLKCGIEVNEEIDGLQHFERIKKWRSDPLITAQRDGHNARAANEHGIWVIRYYQPDMVSNKFSWTSYRKAAHEYITDHADESPGVIVPAIRKGIYATWRQRAALAEPIYL
jgi:hypothetical protein